MYMIILNLRLYSERCMYFVLFIFLFFFIYSTDNVLYIERIHMSLCHQGLFGLGASMTHVETTRKPLQQSQPVHFNMHGSCEWQPCSSKTVHLYSVEEILCQASSVLMGLQFILYLMFPATHWLKHRAVIRFI